MGMHFHTYVGPHTFEMHTHIYTYMQQQQKMKGKKSYCLPFLIILHLEFTVRQEGERSTKHNWDTRKHAGRWGQLHAALLNTQNLGLVCFPYVWKGTGLG